VSSTATSSRHQSDVQIRWLIRRDMPAVLKIEAECFEFPWTEEDFLCCLRQRNCIGMVAEVDEEVVGFMIYELQKSRLRVLNFAVAPIFRRSGIGSRMIARLVEKLSQQRRKEIVLEVRETNLPAQLFFRHQGFRAFGVLRNRYEETEEDAYAMHFIMRPEMDPQSPYAPVNRISELDAA